MNFFNLIYNKIFVRPTFFIAKGLWQIGDGLLIDNLGPDGISDAIRHISKRVGSLQSGYLYHYAFTMLVGLVGIVTWYLYAY